MNQNKYKFLDKWRTLTDARALGLLAFGVVALLVTWSGIKVVQTNYELEKKIAVSKQRNDVTKLKNQNLRLKNQYYESDQYLELAARRQLGKAAPGETLYTVPEEVALAKTIPPENPDLQTGGEVADERNRFQKNFSDWMEFLF